MTALIDLADSNRKREDLLNSEGIVPGKPIVNEVEEEKESQSNWGHLSWLHEAINLNSAENKNIISEKKVPIETLKVGNIIDAQDYLGTWHLSIVCKINPKSDQEYLKLNFLPYPKGNRDEWIAKTDTERIAGIFSQTEPSKDPDEAKRNIKALNEYYHTKVLGQNPKEKDDSSKDDAKKSNSKQQQEKQNIKEKPQKVEKEPEAEVKTQQKKK